MPLGPNLGKSFASTIGAWIVPFEALNHARVEPPTSDAELLEYLQDETDAHGYFGLYITMEVDLHGEILARPPVASLYYTAPQMIAHMTVNGAAIRPGNKFRSGTASGPAVTQRGSLLELAWGGKDPAVLADGSKLKFLRDGDTVTLHGTASGVNGETIDFGECRGTVLPTTSNNSVLSGGSPDRV